MGQSNSMRDEKVYSLYSEGKKKSKDGLEKDSGRMKDPCGTFFLKAQPIYFIIVHIEPIFFVLDKNYTFSLKFETSTLDGKSFRKYESRFLRLLLLFFYDTFSRV